MGITAKGQNDVLRSMQQEIERNNKKIDTALRYSGEVGVSVARNHGSYTDRTGNLRSSVGYLVHSKGNSDEVAGFTGTSEGTNEGEKAIREVAAALSSEHALVMVAGMPYAENVERRGFDVLSQGALEAERTFKELLK